MPGPWWVQVLLVVAALTLLGWLVTLPFAIAYRRLQLDAGLSTSSWPAWVADLLKGQLVEIVATSIALVALVGIARRWRRAWPVVAGGVLAAFVVVASFGYPLLVEPLFNNFSSMPASPLRTEIDELAAREGVHLDDVLVADASRRTTTLNAYVSGFGSTRRVVLYDNLLDDTDRDEVLSVVAHELAHAHHDDVLIGSVLGAAGLVFAVGLLGVLVRVTEDRRGPGMRDPAVVPLVLALLALGSFLALPVQNTISRHIETRADVDALAATADPDAFVAVQRELALHSLGDPHPWRLSQVWFGSHPTTLTRVAIARQYAADPW